HLQGLGVGPEVVVGLCVERSLDLLTGLLGILKAGGAYLPLDPNYPPERLGYLIRDAHVSVVLTQAGLADRLSEHDARVVCLDEGWAKIAKQTDDRPQSRSCPDHLAYVIYTSGSTGQPKGVAGRHLSVANRVAAQERIAPYSDADVCCKKGSIG